jgi:hypothetical protein
MLHQGNGNESVDGVYERERLRRMARKLGLRLVKTTGRRMDKPSHLAAQLPGKRSHARSAAANAGENAVLETEFDKCG